MERTTWHVIVIAATILAGFAIFYFEIGGYLLYAVLLSIAGAYFWIQEQTRPKGPFMP
jgi:hypothetical protein